MDDTSEGLLAQVLELERRREDLDVEKLRAEWFWTDRWQGSDGWLLPMEPRGLYREMLTAAWRRGARLPSDPEAIRRATSCTEGEWARCWPIIQHYWKPAGPYLVNQVQLQVYAEALDGVEAKSNKARDAANKRWERERARQDADARAYAQAPAQASPEHMLAQCPPSPSPSPSQEQTTEPPPPQTPHPSTAQMPEHGQRQRRQESLRMSDQLAEYWLTLARGRLRPATAADKAGWRRAIESGRYSRQQLQGSICEAVRGLLLEAGHLARDAPWPPPGLAPFDVRGSPDEVREQEAEDLADEMAGGER
jgi:uncharacterized protein YdaU (DUF1376 family)